jgi:predicted dienelactone hydrolase
MFPLLVTHTLAKTYETTQGYTQRPRRQRPWLFAAALLLALALAVSAYVLRGVTLPGLTGPHAVGRTTYRWVDAGRPEVMTDAPDDLRAVVVHVWYPAEANSDARPATYLPDLAALRPALAASPEFGLINAWAIGLVQAHALEAAPVASTQNTYPVLIFLPGNRTNAALYTALLEDLASHGYIVAAIDHPYDVEAVILPDGETAVFAEERWPPIATTNTAVDSPHLRFYQERVEVRAQDAVFVLEQLARLNADSGGLLGGHLDLSQLGVFGHSVGGVAAPRACQLEARFGACLNIDGLAGELPFYPDENGNGPTQPFMLLTKAVEPPTDEVLARWQITRAEWQALAAEAEARQAALLNSVAGGGVRVILEGAQHDSFTDSPLLAPAPFNARLGEARRHVEVVRGWVRGFFDEHLEK